MNFESEIQEYLKMKSSSTAEAYKAAFHQFLDYYHNKYGESKGFVDFLDRIFAEFQKPVREQKRIADMELSSFIEFLKAKGKSNNTIRVYFVAVQDFLGFKQVVISSRFMGNLPPPVEQKSNRKHEWSISQIKEFVDAAPTYRDKAIITVLFQSGLGINELCLLDYGDIAEELNKGILPLYLHLTRQKTSVEFKTFLGADSVKYLKLYLATRKDLKPESPLFEKDRERNGDPRITDCAIQQRFSEIAEGLDFIKKNGGYNAARPHSLRAAFISQLTNKISDKLIEFWAGHEIGVEARAYLNMPTEELRTLYMDAEKYLAIERTSRDELAGKTVASPALEEMKKENLELKRGVQDLEERLRRIEEASEKVDSQMDRLFEDPEFQAIVKKKLRELT